MKAQLLEQIGPIRADSAPLRWADLPDPVPQDDEVLIRVDACGVCHTELDEIEGRMPPPRLPMVLGHQVVGRIVGLGSRVTEWSEGDRVGVAWIYSACGHCPYCRSGRENLCPDFQATGRDRGGGYAEFMTARASFAHRIPDSLSDTDAAPLLCAGAIGYRSLRLTNLVDGQSLGLTGFGASGRLVLKMVRHRMPNTEVYVFARSARERAFALELGAAWAGETHGPAPTALDAVIDTTPAWLPVVKALESLKPGGRLVINAIRKEAIDQAQLVRLDYPRHLWLEKEIKSVANVTRQDVREFLAFTGEASLAPQTRLFSLAEANRALVELKTQAVTGAKVLVVESGGSAGS
ncbi:MAG: zinc-dependent alcohol dehydrogenase family protein [Planctomycetes bacterium]|nr:zinc-dependent alcohol dehydrogenase family protein [Planctomycetota bacterium]